MAMDNVIVIISDFNKNEDKNMTNKDLFRIANAKSAILTVNGMNYSVRITDISRDNRIGCYPPEITFDGVFISDYPSYNRYVAKDIINVIFHDPATIVFWNDGSKTVVKTQNGEPYDPEKGIAMAIVKKKYGNKGSYFNNIKTWTDKYEPPITLPKDALTNFNIETAYNRLMNALHDKQALKADLKIAMEEAIEYLGTELDN